MSKIHPTAVVEPGAKLASDVEVGPFSYIEDGVVIGKGCVLDSHVTIKKGTTIGERCVFGQGSIIGGDPQDRKWEGEETFLEIGNDNTFREYTTVHRSNSAGKATRVGNDCYLMAYVHLGHDVQLHNDITIANSCGLSGHVTVEDHVMIGGFCGIHQYVRIGTCAMVGGFSKIVKDIPPYMLVMGDTVRDINAVGLRRRGILRENRSALHKACKLLFKSKIGMSSAIEIVHREVPITEEVQYLLNFVERIKYGKSGRGDQI